MFSLDDINYFARQAITGKNTPYIIGNCDLAPAVYNKIKERYPQAVMYEDGCSAYICLTERSKKKLVKSYESRRKELEMNLNRVDQMIKRIKEDIS